MLIKGKIRFKVELFGEIEETMKFQKEELEKLEKSIQETDIMISKKELEKNLREDLYYLGENLHIDIKELETSYEKIEEKDGNN